MDGRRGESGEDASRDASRDNVVNGAKIKSRAETRPCLFGDDKGQTVAAVQIKKKN